MPIEVVSTKVEDMGVCDVFAGNGVSEHWLQTFSGKALDLLEPKPEQIDIYDIALGLSRQPRWSGQTKVFLSVAEHSVMVCEVAPRGLELAALLHDASEAFLADLPKPLKAICPDYAQVEERVMQAICKRFGVPFELLKQVEPFDDGVTAAEYQRLHPHRMFDAGAAIGIPVMGWEPDVAFGRFIWHFDALGGIF